MTNNSWTPAPARPLTRRRARVLWAVARLTQSSGRAPTTREISAEICFPLSTVAYHLDRLMALGRIAKVEHAQRSARLLPTPGVEVVPLVRCDWHGQEMPFDHLCPGGTSMTYDDIDEQHLTDDEYGDQPGSDQVDPEQAAISAMLAGVSDEDPAEPVDLEHVDRLYRRLLEEIDLSTLPEPVAECLAHVLDMCVELAMVREELAEWEERETEVKFAVAVDGAPGDEATPFVAYCGGVDEALKIADLIGGVPYIRTTTVHPWRAITDTP